MLTPRAQGQGRQRRQVAAWRWVCAGVCRCVRERACIRVCVRVCVACACACVGGVLRALAGGGWLEAVLGWVGRSWMHFETRQSPAHNPPNRIAAAPPTSVASRSVRPVARSVRLAVQQKGLRPQTAHAQFVHVHKLCERACNCMVARHTVLNWRRKEERLGKGGDNRRKEVCVRARARHMYL